MRKSVNLKSQWLPLQYFNDIFQDIKDDANLFSDTTDSYDLRILKFLHCYTFSKKYRDCLKLLNLLRIAKAIVNIFTEAVVDVYCMHVCVFVYYPNLELSSYIVCVRVVSTPLSLLSSINKLPCMLQLPKAVCDP